jgi:hypothetical protein
MSADRWGVCPKCRNNVKVELSEKYGKIPSEEYIAIIERSKTMEETVNCTLREDYQIATDETGEFTIYYGCSCEVCKFNFKYEYKKQLEVT